MGHGWLLALTVIQIRDLHSSSWACTFQAVEPFTRQEIWGAGQGDFRLPMGQRVEQPPQLRVVTGLPSFPWGSEVGVWLLGRPGGQRGNKGP